MSAINRTEIMSADAFRSMAKAVKGKRIITTDEDIKKSVKKSEPKPATYPEIRHSVVVGIDPDCNKSGLGQYDMIYKSLCLYELDLFDLTAYLKQQHNAGTLFVRLEAGHLDKRTWHKGGNGMAKRVGANHEIGRQIEKFMKKNNINYELVPPCGYSDYNHDAFCKITKWPAHILTNPEKRVGGLLAYQK